MVEGGGAEVRCWYRMDWEAVAAPRAGGGGGPRAGSDGAGCTGVAGKSKDWGASGVDEGRGCDGGAGEDGAESTSDGGDEDEGEDRTRGTVDACFIRRAESPGPADAAVTSSGAVEAMLPPLRGHGLVDILVEKCRGHETLLLLLSSSNSTQNEIRRRQRITTFDLDLSLLPHWRSSRSRPPLPSGCCSALDCTGEKFSLLRPPFLMRAQHFFFSPTASDWLRLDCLEAELLDRSNSNARMKKTKSY